MKITIAFVFIASCLLLVGALSVSAAIPGVAIGIPRIAGESPSPVESPQPEEPVTLRQRIDPAIAKGVDFLIDSQNKDGSWGTGTVTRGFEVASSVPGSHEGFRAATTALCVMALREVAQTPGFGAARVTAAHDRGVQFLIKQGDSQRSDGMLMYNTWGNMYVTQALAIEMQHTADPALKDRMRDAAQKQIERLKEYETVIGGWNYYDFVAQTAQPSMGPTSFGTSAALVALWDARQAGLDVPQKMIDHALHRVGDCRLPNGAYLYGADYQYVPRLPANQPRGAIGRDQPCNFALWLWDNKTVDEPKIREGLETFFHEHEFIEMGRQRQFPHESWYQTAPYYYYFDHYYAARLIEKLGDSGKAAYATRLADVGILPHQEPDGSWWDFAMWDYHKPYGTAFAVMTLLRCR